MKKLLLIAAFTSMFSSLAMADYTMICQGGANTAQGPTTVTITDQSGNGDFSNVLIRMTNSNYYPGSTFAGNTTPAPGVQASFALTPGAQNPDGTQAPDYYKAEFTDGSIGKFWSVTFNATCINSYGNGSTWSQDVGGCDTLCY